MNALRPNDLFELEPMESALRNLLRPWRMEVDRAPQIRLDIDENDASYTVKAEIPGVRKEDIDVRVEGNQVTISAEVLREKEDKPDQRVLRSERQYGYASRSFTLADNVDDTKAEAKYDNGVLQLTLPKRSPSSNKRLQVS